MINSFSLKYDADWSKCEKFFYNGSRLIDYMPAVYQLHLEEYSEAGISEMDIVLFNNLISMDTENYTTDLLAEMVRIKSQDEDYSLKLNRDIMVEISGCFIDLIKQLPVFFSLFFLCSALILFKGDKVERLILFF